jgi:septal ring-binding cell division protein DamX
MERPQTTCPTCGAAAERGQLVCLECGSRVALDYRRAPSWKVPLAVAAAVGALLLVAAVIGWRAVNDNADSEVASTPIEVKQTAKSRAKAKAKADAKNKAAAGTAITEAGGYYSWPKSLTGWTVVLVSNEDEESARTFARSANKGGTKVGVIRSNDFKSLPKNFFLVFAGQYRTQAEAEKAAAGLGKQYQGAFPQSVKP